MTIWSPVWKVLIDGDELTDATLSNLSVTSGRTDILVSPQLVMLQSI